MFRFLLIFVLVLVALFVWIDVPLVKLGLILPWTEFLATASAWLIKLFDHDAISQGVVIRSASNGFAVEILPGCNGVEATVVLIAALLAFPAPWRYRLLGIVAGTLAVQTLNLVRIISLFYLGQWNQEVFHWAHVYVWSALIMLDVLVVWLIWVRYLPRPKIAQHAA